MKTKNCSWEKAIATYFTVVCFVLGPNVRAIGAQEPVMVGETPQVQMPYLEGAEEANQALVDAQNDGEAFNSEESAPPAGPSATGPSAADPSAATGPTDTPLPESMGNAVGPIEDSHEKVTTPIGYIETCVYSDGWTQTKIFTTYIKTVLDPSQPDLETTSLVTTTLIYFWYPPDNAYNVLSSKSIHSETNEKGTVVFSGGGRIVKDNVTYKLEDFHYSGTTVLVSTFVYGTTKETRYDPQDRVVEESDFIWVDSGSGKKITDGSFRFYSYDPGTGYIRLWGEVTWAAGHSDQWIFEDLDGDGDIDWCTHSVDGVVVHSGPFFRY